MHDYIIGAMVKVLRPVLKDPAKAKQILDRFWTDKMALVWDVQDVHKAANEREVAGGLDQPRRRIRSGPETHPGRTEAIRGKEHPHH